jgi:hypothetical protein
VRFQTKRDILVLPPKLIHKATWGSPDGATQNQIDHVLTHSKHLSDLLDTRSYRGANIDSDHFLTTARIQSQISTKYKRKCITLNKKYDVAKLQNTQRPQKNLQIQEKKIHRHKKKPFLEEQLKEIENLNSQKESRKFYKLVYKVRFQT